MMSFGERLRKLREKAGLSRDELATKLQLSYWAVAKYEKGERKPDIETVKKIATLLHTTMGYLLGEDEKQPQEVTPSDLKGLIRLRFAKSNLPKHIKDHHLQSILNEIKFIEELEKEKYGKDEE